MEVKLLLVDDHPLMRQGVRQEVARQAHLTLVGEASTGAQALKLAGELTPDLALMDVHLPDLNGLEVTRRLLKVLPAVKVLIFSSDADRALVDEAIEAGACGFLWKSSALEELTRAIDLVMEGRLYLSPEVSAGILEDYRRRLVAEPAPSKPVLSERETQLLRLIAAGRRNKEIAAQLALSVKSIEAGRSRLMAKLGCASAADLVRYAVREGMAAP